MHTFWLRRRQCDHIQLSLQQGHKEGLLTDLKSNYKFILSRFPTVSKYDVSTDAYRNYLFILCYETQMLPEPY